MYCEQSIRIGLASLLLICICTYTSISQTLSPSDLLSPTEIRQNLHGFNGEYMMDQCFNSDDPYSSPQEPYSSIYLSQACKALVNEVSPGIVRFPGGITANFYHFNGTGYGIVFSEIVGNAIGPVDATLDALIPVNFIEPFADLVLQTNSKVIFTVNIYTHFKTGGSAINDLNSLAYNNKLEENMDAIEYLIDRGVDIVGIELGNEMYSYSELTSIFNIGTAINKYLNIAENYTSTINSRFPGIPVGVPVAINRGFGNQTWNQKMTEAYFAEGRVIHEYERIVYDQCNDIGNKESYFDCAKNNVENFFDNDFEAAMEEYIELYPDSDLWLTEWGMSRPDKVSNTFFDAYFVFKYWNKILQFEEDHPGVVAHALRHNLIASGYSYSSFSQKYADESDDLYYAGNKTIHASGYANKLMAEVFDGSHDFIGETVLSGCDAWIFRTSNGDYKAALINEYASPKEIHVSDLAAQLGLIGLEITRHSSLSAGNYYDAAGTNHWSNSNGLVNELVYAENIVAADPTSHTIAGLSLNVLELSLTSEPQYLMTGLNIDVQDCSLNLNWEVENDHVEHLYVIQQNGVTIDSVPSLGDQAQNNYELTLPLDITGSFVYTVIALDNSVEIARVESDLLEIDCAVVELPIIMSSELTTTSACEILATWQVSNDAVNYQYLLTISLNNVMVEQVSIASTGMSDYSYVYQVVENGHYELELALMENGSQIDIGPSAATEVSCIELPAVLVNFEIDHLEYCSFEIQWEVANEHGSRDYILYNGINASPTTPIDTIPSQGNLESAFYSIPFQPEINASYSFRLQEMTNGSVTGQSSIETITVDCMASDEPTFTEVDIQIAANCTVAVSWNFDNDVPGTQFLLMGNVNTTDLAPLNAINSDGSGNYQLTIIPPTNGTYYIQLLAIHNGEVLDSSELLMLEIECVDVIDPAIIEFNINQRNDCTLDLNWTVTNETLSGSYHIFSSYQGGGFELIGTVQAFEETALAVHQFNFDPFSNGNYEFRIDRIYAGSLQSTTRVQRHDVDCIQPPAPYLISFRALMDDCVIELSWQTGNESAGGEYHIFAAPEGSPLEIIGVLSSTGNLMAESYEYFYTPEENGTYLFQIERYSDGSMDYRSEIASRTVECIAPEEAYFNNFVAVATDCEIELTWTVINENSEGIYHVLYSVDGSSYQSAITINSSGNQPNADYTHIFSPEQDGIYHFQIERQEANELQSSSSPVELEITCVEPPTPPTINSFSSYVDGECNIQLSWTADDQTSNTSFLLFLSDENSPPILLVTTPSSGDATGTYHYTFTPPENGSFVFQLELWEGDDQLASYSTGINESSCFEEPELFILVQPAVTFGQIRVDLTANVDMEAEIKIISTWNGSITYSQNLSLINGVNTLEYNLDNFPNTYAGVYQVVVTFSNGVRSRTIIYFG